mmetsp:Transcript_31077/g.84272  ORF Transcript_31077/g.84272 Transcript_31077/m.84272 type:complete len:224 (+) Transcript_31077:1647-2318(+)
MAGFLPLADIHKEVHARAIEVLQQPAHMLPLLVYLRQVILVDELVIDGIHGCHDLLDDKGHVVKAPDVIREGFCKDAAVGADFCERAHRGRASLDEEDPPLPPRRVVVTAHGLIHAREAVNLHLDRGLVDLVVVALLLVRRLVRQHELHRGARYGVHRLRDRLGVALEVVRHHLLEGEAGRGLRRHQGDEDGQHDADAAGDVDGVRRLEAGRAHEGHHVCDVP